MPYSVYSQIQADPTSVGADLEQLFSAAESIYRQARSAENSGSRFAAGAIELSSLSSSAKICASTHEDFSKFDWNSAVSQLSDAARTYYGIAQKLDSLADRVVRAYSLYSNADASALKILGSLINEINPAAHLKDFFAGLCSMTGGVIAGSVKEKRFAPIYAITETSQYHEGAVRTFSCATGLANANSCFSPFDHSEINSAAGRLSKITSRINDKMQGNNLNVSRVYPQSSLDPANCISDALKNEHILGSGSLGNSYATVAIQKFVKKDGKTSWVVTIPGTDGQSDSPFGWFQNAELMSDDYRQRINADSARFVSESMRQAGIPPGDEVALVGHSQGGIVAASLVSNPDNEFHITHIITAGSPIANHPIPDSVWATHVETEDELVSSLDGSSNPVSARRATVRGKVSYFKQDSTVGKNSTVRENDTAIQKGTIIDTDEENKKLSHGMEYHRAAWEDAFSLGSPVLDTHDSHFRELTEGEFAGTQYFQGRMSK